MKDYELTVLFHPDLEMNPDPAIEKVKKVIDQAGGKILTEENEGKKRLAYKIGNHTFALYYFAEVSLPSEAPNKISSNLNITDEVIRFLLVRVDERKAKFAKRRAEAEAREAAHPSTQSPEEDSDVAKDADKDSQTEDNTKEDN